MKKVMVFALILALAMVFGGTGFADLNDGLVVYYPFNGNANDESGNGNNGAVNGAALTTDRSGNADSAFSFDGADDYIQAAHNADFNINPTTGFTVATWFKADHAAQADPNLSTIIDKSHGGIDYTGWVLHKTSGVGSISFGVGIGNTWNDVYVETQSFDDQWHQMTGVISGTAMMLYLDGELIGSNTATGAPASNTRDLFIGKHYSLGRYFCGVIDEVRIYNRPLSEDEILELCDQDPTVEELLDFNARTTFNSFPEEAFKNNANNRKKALSNKIDAVLELIAAAKAETDPIVQDELFNEAIDDLQHDLLAKTNGCAEIGQPDNNDWITNCVYQDQIYPILVQAIDKLNALI